MQGSMHHEVLLALSGYPGSIFRVSKRDGSIEVDSNLPFLHPSEAALLNRLCQLGTHYNHLKRFISEQNSSSFCLAPISTTKTKTKTKKTTLYLKALACGVDRVLHGYRQELIKLEEKCVCEPHQPLSHLQAHLEQFHLLLPCVEACVNHLAAPTSTSTGCQLLSYLHDQCSSGVPSVQRVFEQLLCECHGVLYKQLSAWMLHGLLLADKHEFFIEQRQKKEQVVLASVDEESLSSPRRDTTYDKEFVINHSMAPSYLPLRVLEKIKFVGEAVTIFKDTEKSSDKVQCVSSPPSTPAESRLRSDQLRFADMFAELRQQPNFCLRDFEKVIDVIRNCVAELLWKLLVEESNLIEHLQLVKEFYLLGRGELFLAFIDLSQHFMSLPPSATTQHDVNLAFQQAMVRVGVNREKMAKQFELTVPYSKLGGKKKKEASSMKVVGCGASAWDQLSLCHSTQWPLHTLFTPPILHKYNTLFQVLLRLRRTQVSLHHCWALLMQHHRRHSSLRQVWELRTHMGFLVDNLQYYVQVDVLETQFSQLLERVSTTHDFETIQHAHETFLVTLQSQLFLNQPSISHCLQEVLTLCQQLNRLLQGSQELSLTSREEAEVNRIAKDFGRQSALFYDIISRVRVHMSAPHLAQLLLRIDYNKYYSNSRKNTQGFTAETH